MENILANNGGGKDGTCFVVMGFGRRTDFESGRVLDLDKSYRNLIKPAVEAAGLRCIRADEIVHSGLIDAPMYEQLFNADLVIADLSTSNKNAFYELGVRHALRPFTTVIIAEDGIKTFPFDVNHVAVRQYHHMGDGIDFDEVQRFRELLTKTVLEIMQKTPEQRQDSPVYTFLRNLKQPRISEELEKARVAEGQQSAGSASAAADAAAILELQTHSILMDQVDDAEKNGEWVTAKTLLTLIRQMAAETARRKQANSPEPLAAAEDPSILQRLALATYKSKLPSPKQALMEARELLLLLNPVISNDMVTLGLWGSVHKNLWEAEGGLQDLDESIRAYERGFYNRGDYYNGINLAYMLNARAAGAGSRAEAITDFVTARRVRAEVLRICEKWMATCLLSEAAQADAEQLENYRIARYWVKATMVEALTGLDRADEAAPLLAEASAEVPEAWMRATTEDQLGKLKGLLVKSPLVGL